MLKGFYTRGLMMLGLVALLSFGFSKARAQEGFYVGTGIGLAAPAMSGDFMDEADPQAGIAWELLHLGYNFDDHLGVNMIWGAGAGAIDEDFGDSATWSQGYLGLNGRYTFDQVSEITPYAELGLTSNVFMASGEDDPDFDLVSEATPGLRLAVGGNYYVGDFYVAPEFSYFFSRYAGEAEVDIDNGHHWDGDVDFNENGDMFLMLVKVGYHNK